MKVQSTSGRGQSDINIGGRPVDALSLCETPEELLATLEGSFPSTVDGQFFKELFSKLLKMFIEILMSKAAERLDLIKGTEDLAETLPEESQAEVSGVDSASLKTGDVITNDNGPAVIRVPGPQASRGGPGGTRVIEIPSR